MIEEFKKNIVDLMEETAKGQQTTSVFFDWITIMAISIVNSTDIFHDKVFNERENTYRSIISRYTEEQVENFMKMMGFLIGILTEEPVDVLGEIYHKLNAHNSRTGQFFTPFHLCKLLAETQEYPDEPFTVNEPSSGAGGNILGVASTMKKRGQDYVRNLEVIAQDLDWNCVYMTYVQLSLAGIKGTVIQGDTLNEKNRPMKNQIFKTPANFI